MTTATATVFEVRRSRLVLGIQILFSATLIAVTISHVHNLYVTDGLGRDQMITAGFFAVILTFYLIQSLQHFIDRSARIVVSPEGLTLVDALNETIPWRRVWQISRDRNLLGRQLAIDVDPEIYARMQFGQRFLGSNVIRRRGAFNGFLILSQGYDRSTDAVLQAIRQYWPPAEPLSSDDESED